MSVSRSFSLFKNIRNVAKINNQIRHSGDGHWNYRTLGLESGPKSSYLIADCLLGFAVWWFLWHCWHQPGHLIGEHTYPDPSKWTDADLGIPPDDED